MPESGADGLILVQHAGPDGEEMRHFLTADGAFPVPANVSSLWVELIGGGAKGGTDGEYVAELLSVRPGQTIPYAIGKAGEPGSDGEATTFGPLRARSGLAAAAAQPAPDWLQILG
jgi:hypothetical protein